MAVAPHTLKGLRVTEISLVDAPANPGALHVLYKRKDPAMPTDPKAKPAAKSADDGVLDRLLIRLGLTKRAIVSPDPDTYADAASASIDTATAALSKSIGSILADTTVTDKAGEIGKSVAQFRTHLSEAMPEHIETAMRDVALVTTKAKDDGSMPSVDELTALIEGLTKRLDASELELAKAKMSPRHAKYMASLSGDKASKFASMSDPERDKEMEPDADDMGKAATPVALSKALETITDLQKRVAGFEQERELIDMRKRAVDMGLAETQAEMILKASKGDDKAFEQVLGLIKTANIQARSGALFKEFGNIGAPAEGSARALVESTAEMLRKSDPSLSLIAAKVRVRKADIDLAQRERDEERAQQRAG